MPATPTGEKKPRGRPKKNAGEAVTPAAAVVEMGTPKKEAAAEVPEPKAAPAAEATKTRGRPKNP